MCRSRALPREAGTRCCGHVPFGPVTAARRLPRPRRAPSAAVPGTAQRPRLRRPAGSRPAGRLRDARRDPGPHRGLGRCCPGEPGSAAGRRGRCPRRDGRCPGGCHRALHRADQPAADRPRAARRWAAHPRRLVRGLLQQPLQQVLVEARRVERITPPPVRQSEPGRRPDVRHLHTPAPVPGRVGDGRMSGDQVGAQSVHLERRADRRDLPQPGIGQAARKPVAREPGRCARPALPPRRPTVRRTRQVRTRRPASAVPPRLARPDPSTPSPRRSGRSGRATGAAALPPPGSSSPPAGNGPRAVPKPTPARHSRPPGQQRRAAGRPGDRGAG